MFFWEFPQRLKYKSRRFGTQCRFHHPDRPGRWKRHWVAKRRLLNFRRRGNSQKNIDYCMYLFLHKARCRFFSWFKTLALFWMLFAFFWVIPRLNFICRRFETLCSISMLTCLWRWKRRGVPKRQHITFRRRGITQKKTYNSFFFYFVGLFEMLHQWGPSPLKFPTRWLRLQHDCFMYFERRLANFVNQLLPPCSWRASAISVAQLNPSALSMSGVHGNGSILFKVNCFVPCDRNDETNKTEGGTLTGSEPRFRCSYLAIL